jgi:porphobilinogen synthase
MMIRPRRLRQSASVRSLVRETTLSTEDLIYPVFLTEGKGIKKEIASMPGQFRMSPDLLIKELKSLQQVGLSTFALFPHFPDQKKDPKAKEAINPNSYYLQTIKKIKDELPEIVLMGDVALDPYSSDGHDGLVDPKTGKILNDETLDILSQMSVLQAKAGIDILGPSDMMDGRVKRIRMSLEDHGLSDTLIMSYTAKYASALYGPFRDALDSAPKSGDKKTYQMDYANVNEAIKEARLDAMEGADILMVKPALVYLDVICRLAKLQLLPVAAYQVSGEYAMIKAAAEKGWLDGEKMMIETLTSIKRAGAKIILTYFAKEFALLKNS